MLTYYEKVVQVLAKSSKDRKYFELLKIEDWFKSKSKLFKEVPRGEQ